MQAQWPQGVSRGTGLLRPETVTESADKANTRHAPGQGYNRTLPLCTVLLHGRQIDPETLARASLDQKGLSLRCVLLSVGGRRSDCGALQANEELLVCGMESHKQHADCGGL